MNTVTIHGSSGSSDLLIGERLAHLERYIPVENSVIITDHKVRHLYGDAFPSCEVIEIGRGEGIKTLDTVRTIYERLVALEADRTTMLVGIGGGIVCDITGFVASTYMRGVPFGFVASTLLAQVDASVGGKNGVNLGGYKNMVGVFNQPRFVICDPALLKSLPPREVLCGMGEVVKHAAIADAELFAFLERHHAAALALEQETVERMVMDSVRIKSTIVNRDEREAGERRKLNFGHTLGHAIEKTVRVAHGEAVGAGMAAAAMFSLQKGLLARADHERLLRLLTHLGLPTALPADPNQVLDALRRDKKREGDQLHFILLHGIGRAVVMALPLAEVERFLT